MRGQIPFIICCASLGLLSIVTPAGAVTGSGAIAGSLYHPVPEQVPVKKDTAFDPTGTYILHGRTKKNLLVDHSGELRAQLLDSDRVIISLYLSKGAPRYESGFIMDTVDYDDNIARCISPADSSCTIVLQFHADKVDLMGLYSKPNCNCGFPPGVMTVTSLRKKSGQRPAVMDLSARAKIN